MSTEPDFARRHPGLDQALRAQLTGPVMDAAFRRQVMARVASQRAQLARSAAPPEKIRSRLRLQLVMQLANMGAGAVAAVLVLRAAWPQLPMPQLGGEWFLPAALALGGAALVYGLRRARLFPWVRGLEI